MCSPDSTWPTILPTPSVPRAAILWTAGAVGSVRTAIRFRVPDPYFDAASTPISLEIEMNGKKVRTPLKTTGVLKEDYVKGSETSDGLLMNIDDLKKLLQDLQGSAKADPSYKTVLVKVTDITHVAAVEKEIRAMGYSTSSMESIREPMEKEARQKQMMLGGLGAISLFVAALGITNTMIMSISERTREIGIMKSLGCYVRDIRLLFLSEAGAIGLLGGLVGCVVSMLIAIGINLASFPGPFEPSRADRRRRRRRNPSPGSGVVPPWLLLAAVLFSVGIGLGSLSYYPANKAVQISALGGHQDKLILPRCL